MYCYSLVTHTRACEPETTTSSDPRSASSITPASILKNQMDTVARAGDGEIPVRYSLDSKLCRHVTARCGPAAATNGGMRARDDHALRSAFRKQHHFRRYT